MHHSIKHQKSLEEIQSAARLAGLPFSPLPVQVLHFGSNLNSNDLTLLQLPHNILAKINKGNERLVIRGDIQDDAVLCTNNETYELRQTTTSNTLLLSPALEYHNNIKDTNQVEPVLSKEITSCMFNYLEVRQIRPRLQKLKSLLQEHPYKGEIDERMEDEKTSEEKKKKYTLDDLLDKVQASENELMSALQQLQACHIDGYWRVFDLDYRDQVFQSILTLLEEEDWSWSEVPLRECCDKLSQLEPAFAIEHCLNCYGIQYRKEGKDDWFELIEDKVCQFFAELFLRPAGKFNFHEFMESWPSSVPLGMKTSLDQLKGLALTDMESIPPVIWYFPASDLPNDPPARFSKLFHVREKWSFEDIEPYIRDLETPGESLNALLLKYSRVSTTNPQGKKLYNAKATAL